MYIKTNTLGHQNQTFPTDIFKWPGLGHFQKTTSDDSGAIIETLYTEILNRSSDEKGKLYWATNYENGMPLEDIISSFVNSVELTVQYLDLDK
ncbi:MAG: DUF4214 domain-containing protein [gamma proteobacterium symbiont of Taylorina sp.]|nr:DUF4214 domain-containing protein [gamma proteobacterium symbiont of Taylorina sp.]